MKQTLFILLAESFIVYWWLCLAYARHQKTKASEAEKARYAAWDAAYAAALKADKGQYYAVEAAAKAVRAGPSVLKAWHETYDRAVNDGIRKYKAGVMAASAARAAAHKLYS